ncbi:unnamed protein product, partial [Vitis vinifera]
MAPYSPDLWLPLVLLFLSLLFLLKKILELKEQKGPPGPPKLPIIVSSAEAAKKVLKDHDISCCSRPPLISIGRLSYNYLDISFAPYGPYWREIRKICVLQLFSTNRVQSFQVIREAEVALLIDSLAQSSSSASPVDLTDKIMSLTANMICRIAFGRSFEGSEFGKGRFQEVVHEATAMMSSFFAADFFPYVGRIVDRLTGIHERLEKSFHELDCFYQQVIEEHLNPGRMKEEHEDIIDVLLNIEKEQDESSAFKLTKDHVKAILMDLFLAGVDTGAITVVWAMTELARKPGVRKKVQDEVRSHIRERGKVRESDIEQFHYLKMVVKETLRLHPPVPLLLPKETMSTIEISGYQIYPKTQREIPGRRRNLREDGAFTGGQDRGEDGDLRRLLVRELQRGKLAGFIGIGGGLKALGVEQSLTGKGFTQNLLLAGVNTSASTVVWAMAELARNPIVMKKAQAEVRSVIGNKGKVTESDLDQLLYFKLVVKETFRLHPPSPLLLPRETMSHFQMNGYHIHPKTRFLQLDVLAIGKDPNIWENTQKNFPWRGFTDTPKIE